MNNRTTPSSKIKHVHHVYKISPRCGIIVKLSMEIYLTVISIGRNSEIFEPIEVFGFNSYLNLRTCRHYIKLIANTLIFTF